MIILKKLKKKKKTLKVLLTPVSGQGEGVPRDLNSESNFRMNEMCDTDKVIQKNPNTAKNSKIGYSVSKYFQ